MMINMIVMVMMIMMIMMPMMVMMTMMAILIMKIMRSMYSSIQLVAIFCSNQNFTVAFCLGSSLRGVRTYFLFRLKPKLLTNCFFLGVAWLGVKL